MTLCKGICHFGSSHGAHIPFLLQYIIVFVLYCHHHRCRLMLQHHPYFLTTKSNLLLFAKLVASLLPRRQLQLGFPFLLQLKRKEQNYDENESVGGLFLLFYIQPSLLLVASAIISSRYFCNNSLRLGTGAVPGSSLDISSSNLDRSPSKP